MNYKWNKTNNRGQSQTGFVDIYQSNLQKNAILIVNYLPQINGKNQIVMVTILLEGEKTDWSEGKINDILQDSGDYVKNNEHNYSVDFLNTQLFYLESLNDFSYLNHGDYTPI
ncbi:hypothetical protein ESY86_19790 [Subsaximicrobium wynnwilliamsii]|uniref:Uncharacterized protein n=1 Tax=Subsaximicrobium wynnwilliamsii TaxID=291179 RepID=A0A5C6ZAF7_9FLAO|nr:hypothetical protein [Subsaximicrobium wynnwilliamsii]TXD80892.1 hypothetical protein ESY87_19920 [Subsaximicrobium wynnwilliamsii]TXD86594.1 hypothetical protein ESY86_19790 [Subsaximicrobium wynnwilliamsii]TXE00190.1 hypothetical protein ESY88_19870 [Subsaximicrobium wynnwilliamsii]